jgi:hypothetical protein
VLLSVRRGLPTNSGGPSTVDFSAVGIPTRYLPLQYVAHAQSARRTRPRQSKFLVMLLVPPRPTRSIPKLAHRPGAPPDAEFGDGIDYRGRRWRCDRLSWSSASYNRAPRRALRWSLVWRSSIPLSPYSRCARRVGAAARAEFSRSAAAPDLPGDRLHDPAGLVLID